MKSLIPVELSQNLKLKTFLRRERKCVHFLSKQCPNHQDYALRFKKSSGSSQPGANMPPLSPLPQLRANPSSPRRKVFHNIKATVWPDLQTL